MFGPTLSNTFHGLCSERLLCGTSQYNIAVQGLTSHYTLYVISEMIFPTKHLTSAKKLVSLTNQLDGTI